MNIRSIIAFIRVLPSFSVLQASANDVTIRRFAGKRWCDSTERELNIALMCKRSWFSADQVSAANRHAARQLNRRLS